MNEENDVISGEVMDRIPEKPKPPTLEETRFAIRVSDGEDPLNVVRALSKVGRGMPNATQKQKAKAADLLKKCQEKMILDLSHLTPKATDKLAELLEAKDEVYYRGELVGEKHNRQVQLKAAQAIIDNVKPDKKKEFGVSLFGSVVKMIEN